MKYKILAIQLLSTEYLIVPIRVAFYISYLLNNSNISFLKFIMVTAVLLCEIPSGYLADKISNKSIVYLAKILFISAMLMYLLFPGLIGFIIANLMLGISNALESGAQNTYFIKISKDNGLDYNSIVLSSEKLAYIISFLLTLISSWLYIIDHSLPFLFTAIFFILAILLLCTLPKEHEELSDSKEVSSGILHLSFKLFLNIFKNKYLLLEILVFTIVSSILISNFDYYVVLFKNVNIHEQYFGMIYATFMIINYVGVFLYDKCKRKASATWIYLLVPISFVLLIEQNIVSIALAIVFQQIVFSFINIKFKLTVLSSIDNIETSSQFQSIISFVSAIGRILILVVITFLFTYLQLADILLLFAILTFNTAIAYSCIKLIGSKYTKRYE